MSYGQVDQHTVAACAVFSQQCWLKSFNLGSDTYLVEPFAVESHFESTPEHWTSVVSQISDVMRFGDYFDVDHLHSVVAKQNLPKLVQWENFLNYAPRNVVAVTIQDLNGGSKRCFGLIGNPKIACKTGPRNQSQIDHFTSGCNTSEVDRAMDYLQRYHGFRLIKHVCLNCGHGLPSTGYSPDDIMALITSGSMNVHNMTVLLNTWTYATSIAHKCQSYKYCSDCVSFHNKEYKKLMPSSRIVRDAKTYLQDVLNASSISVAIMIRTERMFKVLKTADKVLHCLDSVLSTYDGIMSELLSRTDNSAQTLKPLITIDIGTFGTNSYSTFCPEYTNYTEIVAKFEHLVSNLYSGEWTLERYESGLTMAAGGVKDSGYLAGLQRVLASQAKCLVLYGAGHFQALAEYYYTQQHPNKTEQCIYRMTSCGYKY